MYHSHKLHLLGEPFDVQVGSPEGLKIIEQPNHTWAGNQPFKVQPKLALVDAGGNTLSDSSNLGIDVTVVQSLSQISDIVIDTTADPTPFITSVDLHQSFIVDTRSSYSNGHNISIIVNFSQEVNVSKPIGFDGIELSLPSLTLNIIDDTGSRAKAYLSDSTAFDTRTLDLTFIYTVAVNSFQSIENIFEGTTLTTNDYILQDAWQRSVPLSIPITSVQSAPIVFQNHSAIISQITSSAPDGEYGPGSEIYFNVEFSDKVSICFNCINYPCNCRHLH